MLLPLTGRRLYYDLTGPENGPVVCITHSLASDGGSWAEQVPPLLQLLARAWHLPRRDLSIIRGAASRNKAVRVAGDPQQLIAQITPEIARLPGW